MITEKVQEAMDDGFKKIFDQKLQNKLKEYLEDTEWIRLLKEKVSKELKHPAVDLDGQLNIKISIMEERLKSLEDGIEKDKNEYNTLQKNYDELFKTLEDLQEQLDGVRAEISGEKINSVNFKLETSTNLNLLKENVSENLKSLNDFKERVQILTTAMFKSQMMMDNLKTVSTFIKGATP